MGVQPQLKQREMGMEITELRIGNLIHDDLGEVAKVCKVRGGVHASVEVYENFHKQTGWTTVFKPMPIPLTKKWLIRCGFENHSPGLFRIKIHPDQARYLETMLSSKFWDFTIIIEHTYPSDDTEVWIRALHHVHELQNLYFALTGEELTISEPTKQSEG